VFVVASARNDFDPAAVLFEWDGVRRDTAPSREAGKGFAARAAAGASGGGYVPAITGALTARGDRNGGQSNDDVDGHKIITMAHGQGGAEIGFDRGPTLTCNHEAPIAAYAVRTANTSANGHGVAQEVSHTLDQAQGQAVAISFGAQMSVPQVDFDLNQTLQAKNPMAVAVSLRGREGGATAELGDEVQNCLRASQGGGDKPHVLAPAQAVGVTIHGTDPTVQKVASYDQTAQCLRARTPGNIDNSSTTVVQQAMQVRRLTPVECERLQGFPDGYTAIPWRKKPASECPDGPRYKALGNSWAVPVVRWIGERISHALR
jgi:DNA (cytosine-5)-methyltransferase 1